MSFAFLWWSLGALAWVMIFSLTVWSIVALRVFWGYATDPRDFDQHVDEALGILDPLN